MAGHELDLARELLVLLVQVVAVEAFQAVDVRLGADRERPWAVFVSGVASLRRAREDPLLRLLDLVADVADLAHHLLALGARLAVMTGRPLRYSCGAQGTVLVVGVVADRVSALAAEGAAPVELLLLEVELGEGTGQVELVTAGVGVRVRIAVAGDGLVAGAEARVPRAARIEDPGLVAVALLGCGAAPA